MSGHEAEDDDGRTASVAGVDESGVVAQGSSEAELFRAGRLSKEEFISRTVERATAHLEGQIAPERLTDMRNLLASQLEHDPHLSQMVSRVGPGTTSPSDRTGARAGADGVRPSGDEPDPSGA